MRDYASERLMQLSADRIGLVMCGHIRAAVRSVFLSTRRYREALSVAQKSGLAIALKQHDADGELVNQDVAIRISAMCSFYLSDGCVKLREALSGRH
jgi:predicted rRNA methylase YqxC with S4 and FtsJ domains